MLAMDFEISDLPPPETVQGLWQSVGSARDATKRQDDAAVLFLKADLGAPRQHVGVASRAASAGDRWPSCRHWTMPSRTLNSAFSGT